MKRVGELARTYAFDVVVALLAIEAMVEIAVRDDPDAPRTTLWFCLPAIAVMVLPLFARRRFPFAAPAAFWLAAVGISFVDGRLVPFTVGIYLIGMATAFLFGNLRDGRQARAGLAIVVGGTAVLVYNLPGHATAELLFIPMVFGISWLAGHALRERAEQAEAAEGRAKQAEREREAAARVAVAEERARIARELHDVVAHAISVMALQVGAVRHRLPESLDEDRDALRHVEEAGRTALAEMRRLLGAMRRNGEAADLAPQPGLENLDGLLEEVGRAGLPVELRREGDPFSLPRAIDLSAYRIVQEGLTNALKHARASRAEVILHYGPRNLEVEIRDDGAGAAATDGLGHGLVGIRERVRIYGGEMSAEPAPTGGFVLRARLPIEGG
ncbi:MAG TPA: histidine kinase [Gaiellaceae bacterium]|nr:histidine kinase [Gaiellaceae bacterium]